jgi:DNA polymerase III delta subunit
MRSLPANQRIHKLIAKVGQIIDCKPPKQLARWIMDRGKNAHGLTIGYDVAELLANLVGENLGRLDSELAKLALTGTTGRVTMADISGTVAFQKEQKIYEMTNALSAGNIEEAVRRWRQLLQTDKSAEFRGITWICLWLESVRKGIEMQKRGIAPAEIARELRIWQRDMIPAFMRVCQMMGDEGVTRAMAQLAEIDYQSKTGVGDAAENVERFMLSLQLH